jgi:hypothetical protein
MMLSQTSAIVLVDLIENKLADLQIGDRNDLREMMTLQRCLAELKGSEAAQAQVLKSFASKEIPTRGRHRKLSALIDENKGQTEGKRA